MGYDFPVRKKAVNKYGADNSSGFSSKLEQSVYRILQFKQKAGLIKNLRCQHSVSLTRAGIGCKVDFSFEEKGKLAFAEAKGCETDRWRIIRKLWPFYAPGRLYIYKGHYLKPQLAEIVEIK